METSHRKERETGKHSRSQPRANWQEQALQEWDSTLTLFEIAQLVHKRQPTVKQLFIDHFGTEAVDSRKRNLYSASKLGEKNPMTGKRFEEHPNWKSRASDMKGYYTVVTPDWYCKKAKRVFEHHVVWAASNGVCRVPAGYVIHHKDCDPSNNTPNNLELMTASGHREYHRRFPCLNA